MFETLFRDALLEAVQADQADPAAGVYRLSFASEGAKVLRRDKDGAEFLEVLSMAAGDADLSLLNSSGVVLANHDEYRQIGTVVPGSARVDADRKARATVKITDPAWLQRLASDRSTPPISVGYVWTRLIRTYVDKDAGLTVRVYAWRGFEVSMLTCLPADNTVGIGRSLTHDFMTRNSLESILELALSGSRKKETLTRAERENYRICNLFGREDCLERDISRANRYIGPMCVGQHFVPFEIFQRDMQATNFAAGGAFAQTDVLGLAPSLLNHSVCLRQGATLLTGLQGNVALPREEVPPTVSVQSEISATADSNPLFGQVAMQPHRLSTHFVIGKQLWIQGGMAVEQYCRQTALRGFGVGMDRFSVLGSGVAGEPLGITQTPGIASVTFGGAPTWSTITKFEDALGAANADVGAIGWAVSPNTRTKWKNTPRTTNGTNFIWDQRSGSEALVNGYSALVTNNLSGTHQAVFGAWPFLIIGIWGNGFDLIIDEITQAASGKIAVSCHLWLDVALVHPQAFVVSVDAANQ